MERRISVQVGPNSNYSEVSRVGEVWGNEGCSGQDGAGLKSAPQHPWIPLPKPRRLARRAADKSDGPRRSHDDKLPKPWLRNYWLVHHCIIINFGVQDRHRFKPSMAAPRGRSGAEDPQASRWAED